jgi:hypothetical protein
MTIRPVQSIASNFGFEAFRFRPQGNVMCLPLAESATAGPIGHCQYRPRRTEATRTRNASASLTLHRARFASVPNSVPVGGFTHPQEPVRFFRFVIAYDDQYGTEGRDYPGGPHVSSSYNPSVDFGAHTMRLIRWRTLKAPPVRSSRELVPPEGLPQFSA